MEFYEEPTFYYALAVIILGSVGLVWKITSKSGDKTLVVKEDYQKEIEPLLDFFQRFLLKRAWASWELRPLFENNPRLSKRLLQHLYTCKETRFLYDLVKDMANHISEKEQQNVDYDEINSSLGKFTMDFHDKFYPIWSEIKTSPNPDFGACDKCKHMKLDHVKKHKKTLDKSDSKSWNLFERSESA